VSIELLAIGFNHDPASATNDALNLRRNARGGIIAPPEWRAGGSGIAAESPAAYAIEQVRGRRLSINVRLALANETSRTAWVRAVDPAVAGFAPANELSSISPLATPAYWRAASAYWSRSQTSPVRSNVLGEVAAKRVDFAPDGTAPFDTFALEAVRLVERGVGASDVNWRWQFRAHQTSPWQDFAWSVHRVYAVLDVPGPPWQQQAFNAQNTQLPWAEILDYACEWAEGAQTEDGAARAITSRVFSLGGRLIEYDCPGGGGTHYTWLVPFPMVDCTAWLDLLSGGVGNGHLVNCIDCASIVSTFANAVGCDLWQSGMYSDLGVPFALNPILAIGSTIWQTACNWGMFGYHEVAWKGACTTRDAVFDACLLVNGGIDPTRPPNIPLLPANLHFGETGESLYRDRLAAPPGRPGCTPQPGATRQRRVIR
jgi:hypothetical protein